MYESLNFELEEFIVSSWMAYLVFFFSSALLIYCYLTRNFKFWSTYNIPSEKPVPVFGTLSKSWKTATHEALLNGYRKFGRLYGGYEGSTPVLYTGDPELIKTVLIKDYQHFADRRNFPKTGDAIFDNLLIFMRGQESKGIRNVMTPSFSSKKLRQMYPLIDECCKELVNNMIDISRADDGCVDAKKLFSAFTTDVIARCAFGTKIDSYRDPQNPFVVNSKKIFGGNVGIAIVLSLFAPWLLSLLKLDVLPKDAMTFFKEIIETLIEERKANTNASNHCDFLQLILESEEPENPEDRNLGLSKKELSTDMILSQCVLFFLAGFETTASALAYTSYLLALNPRCQDILVKEIEESLKGQENEDVLSVETIGSMQYLDGVVQEALRLFPPFSYVLRTCSSATDLNGIPFKPGMMVNIPIYAIHRDPEFFPDPEAFKPERFLPENKDSLVPYTFLPFGTGPRNCLGLRLAVIEIKSALVHSLRRVKFQANEKTKEPLDMLLGKSFLQAREVPIQIVKKE